MMYRTDRKQLAFKAAAHAQFVLAQCKALPGIPIDPIEIAIQRNCEVRFMSLPSLEGIYSPDPRPTIVLGSQRFSGRRAYTCAHELGHHEFEHGTKIEELRKNNSNNQTDPDEFTADMFAAFLLMPQGIVRSVLRKWEIDTDLIEPMQVFALSAYFRVSYGAFIDHLTFTLKILSPNQRKELKKVAPKELKARFGGLPQKEVFLVDYRWVGRAVDLEIDDLLVLPENVAIDNSIIIEKVETKGKQVTFKARDKGYCRAFDDRKGWAVNIRITSRNYEGLSGYRFLNEPEDNEYESV